MKPNEGPGVGVPEPASPFPPAFRWETSTRQAATQVMGAMGRDTALGDQAGSPNMVWSASSYQQHPADGHDLFQPVGTPLDEPPSRPSDSSAPPWAEPELPLIAEHRSRWLGQGPDAGAPPAMSWSKRVIGISAGAIAVVGLVAGGVVYLLAGASPDPTMRGQISAPPATAVPRARPVLPSPAAAAQVAVPAPVVNIPAAPVSPDGAVMTPAASMPAEPAPSVPAQRSTGGSTERRAAVAPAPAATGRSGGQARRQDAASQDQSPPAYSDSPPDSAPGPAPEGWTRVPVKPWQPQSPE